MREENETFFTKVQKLIFHRHILEILNESLKKTISANSELELLQ